MRQHKPNAIKQQMGILLKNARYRAERLKGALRSSCSKAWGSIIEVNHRLNQYKRQVRERSLSEEGIKHRVRQCITPEIVFGLMKYNMAY